MSMSSLCYMRMIHHLYNIWSVVILWRSSSLDAQGREMERLLVSDGWIECFRNFYESLEFKQNVVTDKKKTFNEQKLVCLAHERDHKRMKVGASWSWQEGYSNSDEHSFHPWWAEKHLRVHNTSDFEADWRRKFHSIQLETWSLILRGRFTETLPLKVRKTLVFS